MMSQKPQGTRIQMRVEHDHSLASHLGTSVTLRASLSFITGTVLVSQKPQGTRTRNQVRSKK
jgi:hypothetical protein